MPLLSTQLIDHLDNSLQGKGSAETDELIQADPETALEWQHLRLAVDTIQDVGLFEQVESVKAVWKAQQADDAKPAGASIRTLYRNVMRVAACLLVIAGGAGVFKYSTTSSTGLYNKYYLSYTLNANRGAAAPNAIDAAYDQKNWTAVLSLFAVSPEKNNKSYFLAGMADLELKKYDDAVGKFEQVLAANLQSGDNYFQDEAEFYLAMTCLARNDVNEAIPLIGKIKANKNHLFHETVVKMSSLDLRIAQYRNSK